MAWRGLLPSTLPESFPRPFRIPRFALEILVALSLAFLVWLYIRTRDHESLDNMPIPVQITLAPGSSEQYDLELSGSPHVVVSFVGPPSRIRELRGMLQRGEVRVNVPVSVPEDRRNESRFGDTIRVQAADVPVPPGVTAMVAEGSNRIPITLHRIVERQLPVHLNHAAEDRLRQVSVEPETVTVRGPEDILERARWILTRPYHVPAALSGPDKALSVHLRLIREMEGRPVRALPEEVKVRLTLLPRPRIYQLKNVPVKFLCPPSFRYRPQFHSGQNGKITLRVKAPVAVTPPAVVAYVDLTGNDFKTGLNVKPVQVQLPRDCQLAQEPPESIEFEIVPTDIASGWYGVITEP
jgi:hypothetical protein